MLESDWLTNALRRALCNYFQGNAQLVPGRSWPHYMSISLRQVISVISLQKQNNQNPNETTSK